MTIVQKDRQISMVEGLTALDVSGGLCFVSARAVSSSSSSQLKVSSFSVVVPDMAD